MVLLTLNMVPIEAMEEYILFINRWKLFNAYKLTFPRNVTSITPLIAVLQIQWTGWSDHWLTSQKEIFSFKILTRTKYQKDQKGHRDRIQEIIKVRLLLQWNGSWCNERHQVEFFMAPRVSGKQTGQSGPSYHTNVSYFVLMFLSISCENPRYIILVTTRTGWFFVDVMCS